jgi:hypothetical protein
MARARVNRAVVLATLLLAGCAAPVGPAASELSPAYTPFPDGQPERGGLRGHQAVIVNRDVKVYRLYDSRAPGTRGVAGRMGRYWADFTVASEGEARDKLAVCKGWNNMAKLVTCTLPKDSLVLRAPGHDVNCALMAESGSTAFHPGGAPQLLVPNASSLLKDCTDSDTGW